MIDDLQTCTDLSTTLLAGIDPERWDTTVLVMEGTVSQVCAHFAQANFWYSIDLTARGVDLPSVVPEMQVESDPADLIAAIRVGADLLAAVVAAAPTDARGFHPYGQADASGFAAMACDETLVHTWDIAQAMRIEFEPPAALARRILERLFPWAQGEEDAWSQLLWANGRIDLPGKPKPENWRWHCAPLAEWDGSEGIVP